jgi:WD40 repeat protein
MQERKHHLILTQASKDETSVPTHLSVSKADWPIFICYRQADGRVAADFVFRALRDVQLPFKPEGYVEVPITSVYFDQAAPAVSDWTAVHAPALQRARTFIFVCTPGAYSRLDEDDWVYRELDWWLANRQNAPIIITTHGERWVPKELHARWPNAQHLIVDVEGLPPQSDAGYEQLRLQIRDRILEGIRDSAVQILYEEVEREKSRSRRLIWQRRSLVGLLAFVALLGVTAVVLFGTARSRQHEALTESAQRLVAEAVSFNERRPYAAGAVLLEALRILNKARGDSDIEKLRAGIWQRFRFLGLRPTKFLEGATQPIQSIDISADGTLAVTGSGGWGSGLGAVASVDDTVRLWDLHTNRQLVVLGQHPADVLRVRFDRRADAVVSASEDGMIKVWDVGSRSPRCEISLGQFTINVDTVDFTPNGEEIYAVPAIGFADKIAVPWRWSSRDCRRATDVSSPVAGKPILGWADTHPRRMWIQDVYSDTPGKEWDPNQGYSPPQPWFDVWAAALSPSETVVAVAPGNSHGLLADCSIVLWDPVSATLLRRLVAHTNHVRAVAFSLDGSRLASGDEDGLIVIWDIATGRELMRLEGHSGAIRSVAFGPGGTLLSGSTDGTLRRWYLPEEPSETLLAGKPFRLAITSDGKVRFESNGFGFEKRDSATDAVLGRIPVDTYGFAVASASPLIVTQQGGRGDVRNADTLDTVGTLKGPFAPFEDLAIAGQPAIVASTNSETPAIRIWNTASGERVNKIDRTASGAIAMTPDGAMVAGAHLPGVVRFWEPLSGRVVDEYHFSKSGTAGAPAAPARTDVSITPDGQFMFFTASDGMIVVWDVLRKRALAARYFGIHKEDATSIYVLDAQPAITALNSSIAVVAVKSQIYLWDLMSNSIIKSWTTSRVVNILVPGSDERTFFGAADDLISLRWQLPTQEISPQLPDSERELNDYLDYVGMQIINDPVLGHAVEPRFAAPPADHLSAMLNDPDTDRQMLALSWIKRKPSLYKSLVDDVISLLASTDVRIREISIAALSQLRSGNERRIAAAIAPLLLDRDVDVGAAALFAIAQFGVAAAVATPQLQRVLLTGDVFSPHVGAHIYAPNFACDAIGEIGPEAAQAIPQMIQVIEAPPSSHGFPPSSCVRALAAMGNTQPHVIAALLTALRSTNVNMRYQAAYALSSLPVWSAEIQSALESVALQEPDSVVLAEALETVRGHRPN